ncbi:hypothetical protein [Acidovorax sp.]|uniref:hypothetical protein n=1 Tax=Acidovorax sp. TaxID=1872122 RepID=UPI0025C207E5|nr:hypothetical protein [Acidovorax sp.]MBL7091582.1 hypothetical protein [Acidovorax sp.]
MANLYAEFRRLIPDAPLLVGVVVATFAGGVTVALQGGGTLRVRGDAAVDDRVFVRDGVIESLAPDLTLVEIEV